MKTTELVKRAQAGETMLTGKFLGCTIEKTRNGVEYESTIIAGKSRNVEIKRWARKGEKIGSPRFSFSVTTPVALLGYVATVRDGYLQEDCAEIVPIEA